MYNQNMKNKNYDKNQKNRIGVIVGLIFCVILVICGVALEIVMVRDELLRAMGKISGWDGGGFVMILGLIPMLIVASVVSSSCREKATGLVKTIFNCLRPAVIWIGTLLVVPMIEIIIISLLVGN